ncbi:MAG TPA: GNAT family N-acetyltransferase [Chloroflexota bacterium]|nr:GNAT family N-acetyltransferase [Chloroflexota bacterium]
MTTESRSKSETSLPEGMTLRPFAGEYEQLIAIQKSIDPDEGSSVEGWRFRDESWRHDRYFLERYVVVGPEGKTVGWGQVFHMPWQFHPEKYQMSLDVHPEQQRKGIGSALYEHLLAIVRARNGKALRTDTQETRTAALEFLARRGFEEIQRFWESRLDVAAFNVAPFSAADARAEGEGITITTLADELAAHGESEEVLKAIYEMELAAFLDVPFADPATPFHYDEWRKDALESPNGLKDAYFLAKHGERYTGVSNMHKNPEHPGVIYQGFTGVIREFRGKGVAMALKLQTVTYARANGYREIRTGNNTRNRPMLRINEAMGFTKQPVWVEYEKALS